MAKKVLILSSSPRKHGNSDTLCDEFYRGAVEAGNEVEKIFLRDKKIGYCMACYYCTKHDGQCAINDDMGEILDKICAADVIVLGTPVYFYSASAQLKTVIDRCVARWLNIKNKTFYYIMTAADDSETVMDGTLACCRGLARCFEGSSEAGIIAAKGVYEAGKIHEKPSLLKQAYEMGKQV